MEDKRIRQLVIALLLVVLALGILSLVSTALNLIVPVAIAGIGAFAFYKIVLKGRHSPQVMSDELAESSGATVDEMDVIDEDDDDLSLDDEDEEAARQRLSALDRAQSDFPGKVDARRRNPRANQIAQAAPAR